MKKVLLRVSRHKMTDNNIVLFRKVLGNEENVSVLNFSPDEFSEPGMFEDDPVLVLGEMIDYIPKILSDIEIIAVEVASSFVVVTKLIEAYHKNNFKITLFLHADSGSGCDKKSLVLSIKNEDGVSRVQVQKLELIT